MSEDARIISDYATIKARANFDEGCNITVENFDGLVGEYHIKEQLRCQVERDASRCNQEHFNGWLGRRKDLKEGLIGAKCGVKYFNANEKFRIERKRLVREIAVEGLLSALHVHLDDKAAISSRVEALLLRVHNFQIATRKLEQGLPSEAVHHLRDMHKRGNADVVVEVQNREETDDGKFKTTWEPRTIKAVQGIGVWDGAARSFIPTALASIKRAIAEAVIAKTTKESQLRKWREDLDKISLCEEGIARMENALIQFSTEENIALTCLLVKNYGKQREVAAFMLSKRGIANASEKQTHELVNDIKANVRQQYGGREFRIV